MWYTYLIPPALGAIIGYFTNVVAIRMLFHPHEAKYLLGFQLPFTPGLIPKEKDRIAESVGRAINDNLMNKEILEKNLLSDEMVLKIEQGVESFFLKQKDNQNTVREFACGFLKEENVEKLSSQVVGDFSSMVGEKIATSDLGDRIAEKTIEYVKERIAEKNIGNLAMKFIPMDEIIAHVKNLLKKHVNNILVNNSGEIVSEMVDGQVKDFLDMQVCDLFKGKEERLQGIKDMVVSAYQSVIKDHLPHILQAVDIQKIIKERINEMNVLEMEKLILEVMNKELRAIEWFGALLGGIIGALNLLIL